MKTLIMLLTSFILVNLSYAQEKQSNELWKIIIDEKNGKPMLVGLCNTEQFLSDTNFAQWYTTEYENYKPDEKILNLINLEGVEIVCVLGTWCPDSRREVPRFIKILDELKFDLKNLQMICVDRKKLAEGIDVENYVIERVPTFIFYKSESEIGRIIETPKETLEIDLLEILMSEKP